MMVQQHLRRQLDRVARRYRFLRFWQAMALAWLAAALLGVFLWTWRTESNLSSLTALALLGLGLVVFTALAAWVAATITRSYDWIAQQVEAAYPELRTCLLAAVEQCPDPQTHLGYLQSSVVREALEHAYKHPWTDCIPQRKLVFAALANCVTFALFGLAVAAMLVGAAKTSGALPSVNALLPIVDPEPFVMTIEPGDAEIERGSSLLVLARIQGLMPAEATLVVTNVAGEESRLPMPPSLKDPVFGGRIPLVEQPLQYCVVLPSNEFSPLYSVKVFEYPRLERADAKLVYPSYTMLEEKLVQDVRTVTAVTGTQVTLLCTLNKPVASVRLVNRQATDTSEPIVLANSESAPLLYTATINFQQSRKLKLELVDDAGRTSKKIENFTINVVPNLPPALKPIFPARDLEVSALEEMDLKASVADDFGVKKLGLTYSLAGQEPVDVVLLENGAPKNKHEVGHLLRLEELHAEPDQLVSYYWWAEDIDDAGQVRRTSGDMYFAEVRPFEEIFRQGEQPPGGQQQQRQQQQQQQQGANAQQAQELAKLQKDIINATWKVLRRETGAKVTDTFATDVAEIQASQESAKEQASALGEELEDEQSQEHAEAVLTHMQTAIDELLAAHEQGMRDPLSKAVAAEQAAYQALLKLRAREHEVVRQQQQQSGQQSSQQNSARSQQQREQLNQLNLNEEENRYETQRQAQEQQQESPEDRENRQVLNRLRELARRQHDLNDRLKELQSALEEAPTDEQKEEIRRQLQRLQDEQRAILEDTDELQSRLEQPENQEQNAQQQQELSETRDQVRRASEALQQERVTQAVAAGTRAEQQFDELREEFRRRASDRFGEEMQQMRRTARELEEKERELAEQIQAADEPMTGAPSLREDDRKEQVAEQITQQRGRLQNLQEQMRDTIERAEATEPLLTERLYDTARTLRDQSIEKALQQTERAVRQGAKEQAAQAEAAAATGVQQLREGIEKAAEGVLGDETEALRRAREELQRLSRDLNEELRQNGSEPREGGERRAESGTQPGESAGDQQRGGQQPGQGQPREGEPMPGQRGEQPMPGEGQQPGQGEQRGQGQQRGAGQPGQEPGEQPGEGQQPGRGGEQPMSGEQPGQEGEQPGQGQRGEGQQPSQPSQRGGAQRGQRTTGGTPAGPGTGALEDYVPGPAPLTGENFREWSDRLRDVEEMVDDPELRAEAARIRERAREMRVELKRHSAEPNWNLVRDQIADPLAELQQRVSEELLRRTSKKALVPLDRDPVPPQFSEKLRRYYERLGSGK